MKMNVLILCFMIVVFPFTAATAGGCGEGDTGNSSRESGTRSMVRAGAVSTRSGILPLGKPAPPVLSSRESRQAEARGKPRQWLDTTRIEYSAHDIYPGALGKYAGGYGDGQVESRHEKHEHRDDPDKAGSARAVPTAAGCCRAAPAAAGTPGMNQLLRSRLSTLEIFRFEIRLQPCVNILVWIRLEITPRNHLIKTDIAG